MCNSSKITRCSSDQQYDFRLVTHGKSSLLYPLNPISKAWIRRYLNHNSDFYRLNGGIVIREDQVDYILCAIEYVGLGVSSSTTTSSGGGS